MKRKKSLTKKLTKLNFSTVFFFLLSLVSSTFAWFAYSNVVDSNINVELKAWDIDITENNSEIEQLVNVNIDNFSPGVEMYYKNIKIKNNGDIAAALDFEIVSLRILEDSYSGDDLIDRLAHDYPFFFNFSYDTSYIEINQTANFDIAIGWPLDSGDDAEDTRWGSAAYEFYHNEQVKLANNPNYQVRPCISLVIKLDTKQYVEGEDMQAELPYYKSGTLYRYNSNNVYVINSKVTSTTENLKLYGVSTPMTRASYWGATSPTDNYHLISAKDVIDLISTDVINTYIVDTNNSKRVLGTIDNESRLDSILAELKTSGASIEFDRTKFAYLVPNTSYCYWTGEEIDLYTAYAMKYQDSKLYLYPESKDNLCSVLQEYTMPIECTSNCIAFGLNGTSHFTREGNKWYEWIEDTNISGGTGYGRYACISPDMSLKYVVDINQGCYNTLNNIKLNGVRQSYTDTIIDGANYTI